MSATAGVPTPASSKVYSLQRSIEFIESIKLRRSIRAINNRPILAQEDLLDVIVQSVRESPSPFNIQSSRILILLGEENKQYWLNIILPTMKNFFVGPEKEEVFKQMFIPRFQNFANGSGSVLFFEDQKTIVEAKENFKMAASKFDQFSAHSSGMAHINTWIALSLAGYGASLQHFGDAAQSLLENKYNIPPTWTLHAELVFGSPAETPEQKTYIDDAIRIKLAGSI